MNKKYIPGVIIVEGKHDAAKVSSLYESIFVITNGYEIPKEETEFITHLSNDIQIIVLTDNDEAGNTIRKRLNDIRNNMVNVVVKAPENSKKKGINECLINDIQNALDKYSKDIEINFNDYQLNSLNKSEIELLSKELHLGKCSKKTFVKRVMLLGIKEKILGRINNASN